jgi:hypothetical protein
MASVGERAGMAELRAELLREARGRTLEIGAGTGLNLSHYTEAVTELVLTEPDPFMARRLRDRLAADPPVRVLDDPAGRLLCIEHVRSPDSRRLARWQDRLERSWGWFPGGCHPNRDTVAELQGAGLETGGLVRDGLPKAPLLVRPLVRGSATRLP